MEGRERIKAEVPLAFGRPESCEKRSSTLPRFFTIAPLRCHPLNKRLTVNSVRFVAAAKSSLVTSTSRPPGVFLTNTLGEIEEDRRKSFASGTAVQICVEIEIPGYIVRGDRQGIVHQPWILPRQDFGSWRDPKQGRDCPLAIPC